MPADETPDPEPLAYGNELPARPMTVADVPPGASLKRGRLFWYRIRGGRPLVTLEVRCPRCKGKHRHPWRWDWGIDTDAVSFQVAHCRGRQGRPYWVALNPDPEALAASARAHAEAHEAFVPWEAARLEKKAARMAAEAAALLVEPPAEPPAPAVVEVAPQVRGPEDKPVVAEVAPREATPAGATPQARGLRGALAASKARRASSPTPAGGGALG